MYGLITSYGSYADRKEVFITMCIGYALAVAVFLLFVAPVHNFAKVKVAKACGDTNIKNRGSYTMNPYKSFHLIGVFSLLVLNIGLTAPVNYKRNRFYRPALGTLGVSAVGIAVYLTFSLIGVFIYSLLRTIGLYDIGIVSQTESLGSTSEYIYFAIYTAIYFLMRICMMSAIVNLIPMIPLDMGDILKVVLRPNWIDALMNNHILVALGIFVVLFITIGKPDGFIDEFSKYVISFLYNVISVPLSWIIAIFF